MESDVKVICYNGETILCVISFKNLELIPSYSVDFLDFKVLTISSFSRWFVGIKHTIFLLGSELEIF